MNNFRYFAAQYLNDWMYWDKPFCERVASKDANVAREGYLHAAKYYKVVRNFGRIDEPQRLYYLQQMLDSVELPRQETAADLVTELAKQCEAVYGTYAVSAASKLLWLKYKSPVIIYDSRALSWLKKQGHKLVPSDYRNYCDAWLTEFDKVSPTIAQCSTELVEVKRFTHASELTDTEIAKLTSQVWFHERVFDKCLWFNA
ncbi:hypothetical protein G3R49_00305 [Shewanella sp. WXL01]|uniref:hypothetical protein n=1 Tax=Shewanella sp. WXL01 TaxID=2709721 RepID=UPI0014383FA8|nr:hypothetical protein [Shewanella sp. WXL01]NKF49016.1 hypothetical protein [Shewanella sp. WXL01]